LFGGSGGGCVVLIVLKQKRKRIQDALNERREKNSEETVCKRTAIYVCI
jgi:galactokinase